jgi:hypothetical protein
MLQVLFILNLNGIIVLLQYVDVEWYIETNSPSMPDPLNLVRSWML